MIDYRFPKSESSRSRSEYAGGTTTISSQALTQIASLAIDNTHNISSPHPYPGQEINSPLPFQIETEGQTREIIIVIDEGTSERTVALPVEIHDDEQLPQELENEVKQKIRQTLETTAGVKVSDIKIVQTIPNH